MLSQVWDGSEPSARLHCDADTLPGLLVTP